MGHKINPDIFRLGVSKTWTFQLRTNKNFLKNLFLFKFLRNLFMNYTIPLFNFKKRRNQKFNDKLIFRGEDQLIASPFVKNNLLFSHVFFGLLKNRICIESFFIDVSFKQQRKKTENIKRNQLIDISEFKPWNSYFYKTSVLSRLSRKKKKKKNSLRKILINRVFKVSGKRANLYRYKTTKRLSKDFFFFLRNFNPKYHASLKTYFNTNYRFYVKKFSSQIKVLKKRKKKKFRKFSIKRKIISLRVFKKKKKKKLKRSYFSENYFDRVIFKFQRRKLLSERHRKFKFLFNKRKNLFFVVRSRKNLVKRFRQKLGLRRLKNIRSFNKIVKFKHKYRKKLADYKRITLPKLIKLVSKSRIAAKFALSLKRGLPKNPLYVFDLALQNEKKYTFYKNYKNVKLLKYFLRLVKFVRFFSLKKKIFFTENLISLLMNFFGLINTSILTKKIFLVLQSLIFYNLSYSFYNFVNFKKKFFSKFVFFKGVSKTIHRTLIELTQTNQLSFSVVGQNKFTFNSSLVLNYILIKLGQYFTIHEIVNPLSFYIKSLTSIAGYKILITGRLTRKERAAVMIRSGKRMPLSTIRANIDYSSGFKIMKFGLVGIKVYLLLKPSKLLNLYKFKYNFN